MTWIVPTNSCTSVRQVNKLLIVRNLQPPFCKFWCTQKSHKNRNAIDIHCISMLMCSQFRFLLKSRFESFCFEQLELISPKFNPKSLSSPLPGNRAVFMKSRNLGVNKSHLVRVLSKFLADFNHYPFLEYVPIVFNNIIRFNRN